MRWKRGQQLVLSLAVRYPVSITENEVTTQLTKALFPESEVTVIRRPLVRCFQR